MKIKHCQKSKNCPERKASTAVRQMATYAATKELRVPGGMETEEGIICRTSGTGDVVCCLECMYWATKGQIFFHKIKRRRSIHS